MKVIARLVVLLSLLTLPFLVRAAPASDQVIAQLLELSGARQQLAAFPDQVIAGMDLARQQQPGTADADVQRMQKSMQDAFQLEDLLSPIRTALKNSLSEDDARQLLAWLQSDRGRRIVLAEEASAEASALQDMLSRIDEVRRDKAKLGFARRIDLLLGITELNLLLQEYAGMAIHAALLNAVRPHQSFDAEAYRGQVRAQLAGARPRTEEMVRLSLAHAYRDIPASELAAYERFLKTPAASRFYRASMSGMTQGYAAVLDKMMQAMINSMGSSEIRT